MDAKVAGEHAETMMRRPLKSRSTGWASWLLRLLLKTRLSANQISAVGILFAACGAAAMIWASQSPILWWVAAVFVQLRLVANLMDGLVAVEGGRGGPTGAIWNEAPDRLEDSLLLVAAGYAVDVAWLGWLAALMAAFTAYVRLLGATFDLGQDFRGPMAKPHRMAVLTAGAILAPLEAWVFGSLWAPTIALGVVVVGAALTLLRRIGRQGVLLSRRGADDEGVFGREGGLD
ncbi:CDP-alcohol phosphatidyltransferase family protein [Jiella marina]|uniref:CDP-alcohol phosphatidyltransferase family protein n=1 Tax=Jiella sp. LLJ827 TaxID=2917712 RepID=UPI002100F9EF|nr:CDP-alcohol phosphatidyltransferase family protein [Jiella sp. LLJ827]MCQ0988661.1 CDP-alcohol phosphatidyltransferase family protein [Jiella sp. LLJ827]